MNETTHDEENPSEDEDDTSEDEHLNEMLTYENNGEQNNAQESKLLITNFEVKVENQKVEGLITYSTDQQIFKLKVNSGTDQEVWGVYNDLEFFNKEEGKILIKVMKSEKNNADINTKNTPNTTFKHT